MEVFYCGHLASCRWAVPLSERLLSEPLVFMGNSMQYDFSDMRRKSQAAVDQACQFHDSMLQQHTDADTVWFVNILTALLKALVFEYGQLNREYDNSTRGMAWACRNLMEISVYTEYALLSEQTAHELIDDMFIDVLDVFKSFKKWFTALEPTLATPDLDLTLRNFEEAKINVGIQRNRYHTTRELAKRLGREPDYDHANKVSSKLIHPTAWSLLTVNSGQDDGLMRPYIYWAGSKYFHESFTSIRRHVIRHGTSPAPNPA